MSNHSTTTNTIQCNLETELQETKSEVKMLKEKLTLLETMFHEQKRQTFEIIPVWLGDRYKFYNINCKEILIGINPNLVPCFHTNTQEREIKLYFDKMEFDSLFNLYLNSTTCDTGSFSETTHLDAFIRQFKSCKLLKLNFGILISYPDQYHNKTHLIKFIAALIGNIVSNNDGLDIIITGCNPFVENEEHLYTYILQELLKFTNYKKIHFNVKHRYMDGNYCDACQTFIAKQDPTMMDLKRHCLTNGIEYVTNIV